MTDIDLATRRAMTDLCQYIWRPHSLFDKQRPVLVAIYLPGNVIHTGFSDHPLNAIIHFIRPTLGVTT